MFTRHSPATITQPASAYCQGISAPADLRWLHISGQVGANPDGSLVGDAVEQIDVCWKNVIAVLEDAGMTTENLVKVTAYVTDTDLVGRYRESRDTHLDGHLCASTLIVTAALAHPDWKVEIEAIAAG